MKFKKSKPQKPLYVPTEEHKAHMSKGLIKSHGKRPIEDWVQKLEIKPERKWKRNNIVSRKHYVYIHRWVAKNWGAADKCDISKNHSTPLRYEWANISGCYTHNREDWIMLCKSCHTLMDSLKYSVQKLKDIQEAKMRLIEEL